MAELDLTVEKDDASLDMEVKDAQRVMETDHSKLTNRDAEDAHPIEAITGLAEALEDAAQTLQEFGTVQTSQGETIAAQGEIMASQGERIRSLEENKIRLMTVEEAREILNG